jgi:hypothetical protein
LTSNGTIEITGAGTIAQYVRGDGTLETFPSLTGFVPYTGATQNVDLGEFGVDAGFVQLDTTPTNTPTSQGTIFWDVDDETVDVVLNGYIMKIGEDQFYPVKNQTGSSIAKGTAVRFAGTVGASGRLLIAPFIADGSVSSSFFMGVTAEAIADGADGKVLYFGRIRGINTNAFNEGDVLYASTTVAGGFQTAVPVAPNNIVQVAAVINKSINQGVIFIRPSFGSNINQDEGVKIVSPTTGQLLQLQANGLWENKTTAQVLGGTSSQFVKGDGTLDSNTYQVTSEKGEPNGYASLDSNGKVPLVQINDALIGNVNFQGLWNASTNTPTLANPPASGTKGYYYIVSTAGTFASISFEVGDWIISDGTAWGKVDNTDAVSSVFGRTGNVVAANGDYTTAQVTESGNLYYTDGRARAAISLTTTGASGSSTYNNSTGVLNVPAYTLSGLGGIGGTIASGQVAFGTAANTIGGSSNLIFDSTNVNLGIGSATAASIDPTITSVVIRDVGAKVLGSKTGVLAFQTNDGSFIPTFADGITGEIYSISENASGSVYGLGFLTSTISGANRAERWRITSTGILQSNGAQTIQTSTGNLTLTSADNTGIVDIRRTDRALGAELRLTNSFNGTGWLAGDVVGTLNFVSTDTSHTEPIRSQIKAFSSLGSFNPFSMNLSFSTANGNILTEGFRLSPSSNLLVGTITDSGFRLDVNGTGRFSSDLTANSFIKSGGTSSQFLKADGSIDSNTYVTGGPFLPLTGGTLTGALGGTSATFSSNVTTETNFRGRFYQIFEESGARGGMYPYNLIGGGTDYSVGLFSTTSLFFATGDAGDKKMLITAGGNLLVGTTTDAGFKLDVNGTGRFTSNLTANSFIKSGGTSTQFLKADGSIDSNTYVTGGPFLSLSGGTMTGVITTPNGTFGIIVGDDSRLADRNIANTLFLEGVQNPDRGYINFGDGTGNALGAIFNGDLTWKNNVVWHAGNITPVTGTGVNGRVAFWNGTNTITSDSNLFWDATNDRLGIGVNIPLSELQINKSSDVTLALSNSSSITTGNRGSIAFYNSSNSTIALIRATAITDNVGTELEFHTNTIGGSLTRSLILRQNQSAEFAKSVRLNGTLTIHDTDLSNIDLRADRLLISSDNPSKIRFGGRFNSFSYGSGAEINLIAVGNWSSTNYGANLTFSTVAQNSTTLNTRMTIMHNGNVGIGTTIPSEILHLNKTSGTGTFIRFQDTAGGGVYIGGRSEAMELYAGGSEAMRITSARNVGIGTTSPFTSSGYRVLDLFESTNGGHFVVRSANVTAEYQADEGTGGAYFGTRTNHFLSIRTNTLERMRITSGGNVLIGTTTDSGPKLAVNGLISSLGNAFLSNSGNLTMTGTYQTIFTAGTDSAYFLTVQTNSNDGTYAIFTLFNENSGERLTSTILGNNIQVQFSGNDVQIRSANGVSYLTTWSAIRIK